MCYFFPVASVFNFDNTFIVITINMSLCNISIRIFFIKNLNTSPTSPIQFTNGLSMFRILTSNLVVQTDIDLRSLVKDPFVVRACSKKSPQICFSSKRDSHGIRRAA